MPAPYSQDLRDRVVALLILGSSARAAAAHFGISVSTAIRWAQRWRAEGQAQARPMGGDHRSLLTEHRLALITLIAKQPDLTLEEIKASLVAEQGVSVGIGTVWRFLESNDITVKKRLCLR